MAVVGDEEALVDSYDHVEVEDCNLYGEIENIEACFALIPGRVGPWPLPTCVIDSCAERCTCTQESSSEEQDCYLVPEAPGAKFLHASLARYDERADDEQDR